MRVLDERDQRRRLVRSALRHAPVLGGRAAADAPLGQRRELDARVGDLALEARERGDANVVSGCGKAEAEAEQRLHVAARAEAQERDPHRAPPVMLLP